MRLFFHVYFDKNTQRYEIYKSPACEIDKYSPDQHEYYFAVFMRGIDASNYVKQENDRIGR